MVWFLEWPPGERDIQAIDRLIRAATIIAESRVRISTTADEMKELRLALIPFKPSAR